MSTDLGEVKDNLDPGISIEIAVGTGGIKLFSTEKKIWLDNEGADKLIDLLKQAKFINGGG